VGELIGLAPNGMGVMVIADHGAKKMDDGVYCNEWLIQEGCLALTNDPDRPT
jgi:predicted AlkP superfamily phosphohydrolase/phosphomutase